MILAVDPGIAATGWAIVRPRTARVLALGVLVTKPMDGVAKSTDRARRIAHLAAELRDTARAYEATHIAAESMLFHGANNAVTSQLLCWGMLVGLAAGLGLRVHEVRAKEWQHAIMQGGKGPIDYDEVARRVAAFVGSQVAGALGGISKGLRTHALDAVGVGIFAALTTTTAITLRVGEVAHA